MDEKPTGGDAGVSIEERVERIISHQPEEKEEVKQEAPEGVKEEASEEVEAPESDAQEEEDGPQISLSDAAKILGVDESILDVDEDGTLKIKTKIDGQEGAAKLQDFLKSYQLQGHIDAKSRAIAEEAKRVQAERMQFEEMARNEVSRFETLVNVAQQQLMREFASVDWDDLSENYPTDYIAKKHAFEARHAQIQGLTQQAMQYRQQLEQSQQMRVAQHLQAESQRLTSAIPEWSDPNRANQEKAEMAEWLMANGASPQAVNSLYDAGIVAALRKAMLADKAAPKVAAVEKKVRAAPKLVKPGQSVDASQRKAEGLQSLKERIKKTGGKGDSVTEWLIAAGKV